MSHQAELFALHGRLVAGDLRAAYRIVELAILPLKSIVALEVPMTDPQDIEQACMDALLEYLQNPAAYDPSRAQVLTYLAVIAKGKAKTIRRSNGRRLDRDTNYVKDQGFLGPPHNELELSELNPVHRADLVKDPGDNVLLGLIATGVNELPVLAKALDLSDDEQGYEAARMRLERMRGRLRRLKTKIVGV